MRAWKCKQVVDFDQSTTIVTEEKKRTPLETKDKSIGFIKLTVMSFKQWRSYIFVSGIIKSHFLVKWPLIILIVNLKTTQDFPGTWYSI